MGQNRYKFETKEIIIYYINKLPIIIGIFAAIITGLICYNSNTIKETYVKMFTAMIIFGSIGFYARFMLKRMIDDLYEANNSGQEELIDQLTVNLNKSAANKNKSTVNLSGEPTDKKSTINLKADEDLDANTILSNNNDKNYGKDKSDEDDFSPLTVSKVISKQIKK